MKSITRSLFAICLISLGWKCLAQPPAETEPKRLAITERTLTWEGDLASKMVDGVDRFLLRKLQQSQEIRDKYWEGVDSAKHTKAEAAQRQLRHLLGIRDERTKTSMRPLATVTDTAEIAKFENFRVLRVRWSVLDNRLGELHGEGILIEPDARPTSNIVAIPDCDQAPEQVFNQYAARFGAGQCRVVIPKLVSRDVQRRRNAELTHREYLYRSSFQLGRQVTGYELQKVSAVIDWFESRSERGLASGDPEIPVGVIGWGEGGRLAMLAAPLIRESMRCAPVDTSDRAREYGRSQSTGIPLGYSICSVMLN